MVGFDNMYKPAFREQQAPGAEGWLLRLWKLHQGTSFGVLLAHGAKFCTRTVGCLIYWATHCLMFVAGEFGLFFRTDGSIDEYEAEVGGCLRCISST